MSAYWHCECCLLLHLSMYINRDIRPSKTWRHPGIAIHGESATSQCAKRIPPKKETTRQPPQTAGQKTKAHGLRPPRAPNKQTNKQSNQSTNQPINQSIDRSTNQSINQSTNQSTNQSINQSTNQSTNQSSNQSLNERIKQSIHPSIHPSNQPTKQPTHQSIKSINQSINQASKQAINQSISPPAGVSYVSATGLRPSPASNSPPSLRPTCV